MTTRGDLDRINQGAVFQPQTSGSVGDEWDGTRPCLNVAGVQVYAYVEQISLTDGGPTLVVSIDYDTAGDSEHVVQDIRDGQVLGWGKLTPTEVRIGPSLRVHLDAEGRMRLEADR